MNSRELATLPASWEFYFCSIEKHPASIMVDLAWEEHAPVKAHPELIEVNIPLLSPDDDGLSDTTEAPRLFALEDQLAAGISSGINGWYVGRMTGKGKRVFYFYAPTSLDARRVVERTLEDFPEYNWVVTHQFDPHWKLYQELLVPSEEEAHLIRNRRALDELVRRGDKLSKDRPITHQFRFQQQAHLDYFLKKSGIGNRDKIDIREENTGLILKTTRRGSIERSKLDETTWDFAQLAKGFKGQYLGWRSEVVSN